MLPLLLTLVDFSLRHAEHFRGDFDKPAFRAGLIGVGETGNEFFSGANMCQVNYYQSKDAAYRAYQQAKESPESDARTTNQQTRQG